MGLEHKLLFGKVMHKRLFPTVNQFIYRMYYLAIPLSKLESLPIAFNKPGLMSFHTKDHGNCDGSDLENWARAILQRYRIDSANGEIILVCLPRILGYVFNPVSFWLCLDQDNELKAVLCEVNNTFGERHTYLCANSDQSAITLDTPLESDKVFHVSPFLERKGQYRFIFRYTGKLFTAHVDYYNGTEKQLITSLHGELQKFNSANRRRAFWQYPLVTLKTIVLIHWQALKILWKKIPYISRPKQLPCNLTHTQNLTKN